MYVKKSIPNPGGGAGNPSPKSPTIIIVDVEDIKTFPTRSPGNVVATGDLELNVGAKAIGVYATPSTIEEIQTAEGEADARGYVKGVKFTHPGESVDIENFIEGNANRNIVAVVTGCNGGAAKIIGSPCNPLSMTAETAGTKDATNRTITLQQAMRDQFRIMRYSGTLPPIETATAEGA